MPIQDMQGNWMIQKEVTRQCSSYPSPCRGEWPAKNLLPKVRVPAEKIVWPVPESPRAGF